MKNACLNAWLKLISGLVRILNKVVENLLFSCRIADKVAHYSATT